MAQREQWVEQHTILSVVVGSRAFGLATAASDVDRRGVYVAPTEDFWRIGKPPTHLDGPLPEQFSWEVERFCALALSANPNLLEVLHSPLVERVTPLGRELRELSPAFLSRRAHQTYARYAQSRFAKAQARRADAGEPRWKHVMHLLRLLISGAELLESGTVRTDVGSHRDRLLAVRRGELPWREVCAWRDRLTTRLDEALAHSPLPAEPDTARVEEWLVSVRRRSLCPATG
ncbi:DNA polymerase beta superfamily protein [Streptomyces sp. NPDC018031]|uniref:nucleotidyltransferase domain-containing protein n=1 Tax=Streptomyces sp. NPDC018031 TaxID=3365033 RepID=UPI0037B28F94